MENPGVGSSRLPDIAHELLEEQWIAASALDALTQDRVGQEHQVAGDRRSIPGRKRPQIDRDQRGAGRLDAQRLVQVLILTNSHQPTTGLVEDGILAYFPQRETDAAVAASTDILEEMNRRRRRASGTSPHHLLYGGVGMANGMVYEGNIGPALKRDFTILGNTVNLASRLESLTRELKVQLIATASVADRARTSWGFQSLGTHTLKGQSKALEIFGLKPLQPLHVAELYQHITEFLRSKYAG